MKEKKQNVIDIYDYSKKSALGKIDVFFFTQKRDCMQSFSPMCLKFRSLAAFTHLNVTSLKQVVFPLALERL